MMAIIAVDVRDMTDRTPTIMFWVSKAINLGPIRLECIERDFGGGLLEADNLKRRTCVHVDASRHRSKYRQARRIRPKNSET